MLQNPELWQKILSFDLDESKGEYCFSVRLAAENGWTKHINETAILEYKKFMYLAAISEEMVSPSEIVDIVWHQHLIFTLSYEELCKIIGRKIEHIPSTHDSSKERIFKQAVKHTQQLYRENFGNAPEEIWRTKNAFEIPGLKKAKSGRGMLTLIGIIVAAALFFPLMNLWRPFIITLNNPGFMIVYIISFFVLLILLNFHNRKRYVKIISAHSQSPVIQNLSADEMIYLQRNALSDVIQFKIDKMVKAEKVLVTSSSTLNVKDNVIADNPEEQAIIETIKAYNGNYFSVMKILRKKPVFKNIIFGTEKVIDLIGDSKASSWIFILNMSLWFLYFSFGLSRLLIGSEREKPILFIFIFLCIIFPIILIYLNRFTATSVRKSLLQYFRKRHVFEKEKFHSEDWNYFLIGTMAMSPLLIPFVTSYNNSHSNNISNSGSDSVSSCGSDGGSSCGGGGCGGCGGGGD